MKERDMSFPKHPISLNDFSPVDQIFTQKSSDEKFDRELDVHFHGFFDGLF